MIVNLSMSVVCPTCGNLQKKIRLKSVLNQFFLKLGAAVAQWFKRWPTDLAD